MPSYPNSFPLLPLFGVHKAPVALEFPLHLLVFARSRLLVRVLLIQVSWPMGVGAAWPAQQESGCAVAPAHTDKAQGRRTRLIYSGRVSSLVGGKKPF